jgi:DNA adenine methylase
VMLSGYRSELYDRLLSGWRRYEFQAVKRNGQKATECLWMNFPEPMELHDYRWLGTDRIDRQRIKRKTERWRAKFRAMPANERYAILHALKTSGISQLKATAAATADNSDCHRAQMEQTTFA